jgi:hypothetical protein
MTAACPEHPSHGPPRRITSVAAPALAGVPGAQRQEASVALYDLLRSHHDDHHHRGQDNGNERFVSYDRAQQGVVVVPGQIPAFGLDEMQIFFYEEQGDEVNGRNM